MTDDDHTRPPSDETLAAPYHGPRRAAGGASIPGYRIVGKLGEGGMGSVFEAEQESPRRRVALKISHGGPMVDEVRLRLFEREIESLGRLVHPNIAAIHGAGRTSDGRHYFAMELVAGETLDDYLDARGAPRSRAELRERLGIFRAICNAVHYAHQRGVVHRDLKPGNVIIGEQDESVSGSGAELGRAVKVLDFGLARITDSDVAAATVLSEIGTVRGTLPYMAPEQTKGDPGLIDVRADVYALGVMLHEMLTGQRPYDVGNSLMEAARIICEERPKLLTRASDSPALAEEDLQTIVSKALEKEPDRRYQSAAAFAGDVERFLAKQPILARPPSTMYQLRKAVERNRTVSALVALLALAVIGFGFWMSVLYARAEREARISSAVNQFLNDDLLAGADPRNTPNPEITVREVLERASGTVEERFADRPLVQAAVRDTLGQTYLSLGLYEAAEPHLRQAYELRETELGAENAASLRALARLGDLHHSMGLEDAEAELNQALELQRKRLGADHVETLVTQTALARRWAELGRLEAAEALARDAFERLAETRGPTEDETLGALDVLSLALLDLGRLDEAEVFYERQIAALEERYGVGDPRVVARQLSLGWLYNEQGRMDEAVALTEQCLETMRRVMGSSHPETLVAVNNLGVLYRRTGRTEEAVPLYLEAYEGSVELLGQEHPETLVSMSNLGRLYQTLGRCQDAVPILVKSVALHRVAFEDPFIGTGYTVGTLGECQAQLGLREEARASLEDSLRILRALPAANPERIGALEKELEQLG